MYIFQNSKQQMVMVNYDVNLAGIDEINHHIIVATKDVILLII